MPKGKFRRVVLKGDRDDRPLFLSIANRVEEKQGPIGGDGSMVQRFLTDSGPVYARITKSTISVQRQPFMEDAARKIRRQDDSEV